MNNKNILPLAVLAICATVAILYWQMIYLPVKAEISRLDAETKQIEIAESELKNLQARYGNLEELFELTQDRLAQMQEYLPFRLPSLYPR